MLLDVLAYVQIYDVVNLIKCISDVNEFFFAERVNKRFSMFQKEFKVFLNHEKLLAMLQHVVVYVSDAQSMSNMIIILKHMLYDRCKSLVIVWQYDLWKRQYKCHDVRSSTQFRT